MKRVILALLLALLWLPGTVAAVDPQPKQRMVVTPSSVDLLLAPGESSQKDITVVNKGTEAFSLNVTAAPYSIDSQTNEPSYKPIPGSPDVTKWVTTALDKDTQIAPEAVQEISYTVSVPPSTPPGGYLLAILVTATPITPSESVTVRSRIAVINYVTVKGEIALNGKVTASPFGHFSWNGTLKTEFIVKNNSPMYFTAATSTVITPLWGQEVGRVEDKRPVLPFTEKYITLDWQSPHTVGIYKVERSVNYLGRTESFPAEWFVVVHPLLIAGAVLLLAGLGLFVGLRKRRRGHTATR